MLDSKQSNVLPICSHCKSIRRSDGYWADVEEYLAAEDGSVFSHGICFDCFNEHYSYLGIDNKDDLIAWTSRNLQVKVITDYTKHFTLVKVEKRAEALDFFAAIDHMYKSTLTADSIWDFSELIGTSPGSRHRDIQYAFSRITTNYDNYTDRKRSILIYNQVYESVGQALREVITVGRNTAPGIDFELFTDYTAAMTWYLEGQN